MSEINWGILANSINQPNPGERFMAGYGQGQQQAKERKLENALRYLGSNPDDPQAQAALMQADPRMGIQYRQQQLEMKQQEQRRQSEQSKQLGEAAKTLAPVYQQMAKMPYEQRRSFLQQIAPQLLQRGIPAELIQSYDPTDQALQTDIALSVEHSKGPASVQEFEYAKAQGFDGDYMAFLDAKGSPFQFDITGDGVADLVPREHYRSLVGGKPAPQAAPAVDLDAAARAAIAAGADPAAVAAHYKTLKGGAGQQAPQTFP